MGCLVWVIWICTAPLALTHIGFFLIWILIPLMCGGGKKQATTVEEVRAVATEIVDEIHKTK